MDLVKMGVAHRERNGYGGVFVVKGKFLGRDSLVNQIENELRDKHIFVTTKICVISELGCIVSIDRFNNENIAVEAINSFISSNTPAMIGYEAQTVPQGNKINIFEWKTVDQMTKPIKQSKAKKDPVPPPYSY